MFTRPASPTRRLPIRALAATALAVACSPEVPVPGAPNDTIATADSVRTFSGRFFERNVVFLTTRADSTLVVPWLMTARTRPGSVDRTARGLLARSGTWESFFSASWESPPTRVPWRILPHGSMRLVVGDQEDLDRIVFEEGARQLHVVLGDALVEWSGQGGETFRLVEGALLLSAQRVPGIVLDMARARRASDPRAGDWLVLTSGDSLQVALHDPEGGAEPGPGGWRGWARLGSEEIRWPSLAVEWSATRAFEPARREVPARWTVRSAAGEVTGTLESRAAELIAGEGEGPQLPVDAFFEVAGTLEVRERAYPVHGFLRHEQR
jgi:hypothetical protein